MSIAVKICGLTQPADIEAINAAKADYAGFVFFEKSPRNIAPRMAQTLASQMAPHLKSVALMVNPSDDECQQILKVFSPDYIQLHGLESPHRVGAIKALTACPIIKAIGIKEKADLETAKSFKPHAEIILFDAKPPAQVSVPGGRAIQFDWSLLTNYKSDLPWMLSGGLTAKNVKDAIAQTRATMVDVSSGVENIRGQKDVTKISNFIHTAKGNA